MSTWAENLARDDQSWTYIIRIDGLGPPLSNAELVAAGDDGRLRICTAIPSYASSMPTAAWEDILAELPSILKEKVDELGGATELGSATLEALDADDLLTALIRTERPPLTRTTSAILTTTDTSIGLDDTTGVSVNDHLYLGAEAVRVTAVGGSSVTVERGALNTDATTHAQGVEVYQSITFLRGRRVSVHSAPLDGDSDAEERELGTYVIDSLDWGDNLNRWIFQASSQLKPLAREIPLVTRRMKIIGVREGDPRAAAPIVVESDLFSAASFRVWTNANHRDLFYLRHSGGEVFTVRAEGFVGSNLIPHRRDVLETGVDELKIDDTLHQVFVAEHDGPGSYRWSPGPSPSTDRDTGTWLNEAHFIPLIAILLTSSAHRDDGLELQNYVAAYGNFSSLPPGFGVGYPAARLDWAELFDVWNRTPDYVFPKFVFGDEPTTFGELVTENFLRPMGAYFVTSAGLVRIVLPRIPLVGSATITIGPENLLTREVGRRLREPRIDVHRDKATQSSAIRYVVGPAGGSPVTFHSSEFGSTYGQGGYYGSDEKPTTINVPGGDPKTPEIYARRGLSRLWRTRRPRIVVDGSFDASIWDSLPLGETASMSLEEMPDLSAGVRSWGDVTVQHLEAEPRPDVGQDGGFYTRSKLVAYGANVRIGRVSASARIDSVATDVATIRTNRYTHTDATGGLPTEDAAAFQVGHILMLINLDGTDAGSGLTQAVLSVSGDDVELDGDFGGALAAGLVLVFANHDDAVAAQTDNYAFMSDRATLTVGAGSDDAWLYGES